MIAPQGLEIGESYCDYMKKPMMSPNRRGPDILGQIKFLVKIKDFFLKKTFGFEDIILQLIE